MIAATRTALTTFQRTDWFLLERALSGPFFSADGSARLFLPGRLAW
jgi:hypothetical protein